MNSTWMADYRTAAKLKAWITITYNLLLKTNNLNVRYLEARLQLLITHFCPPEMIEQELSTA